MEEGAGSGGLRFVDPGEALWGDARGWGTRPLDAVGVAPGEVGEMHLVSLEPGAVRGNHRHPEVTEWLVCFGGPLVLAWRTAEGDRSRRLPPGEPVVAEIDPDVPHAVRNDGEATAYLLSWADGAPTTHPVRPLL